MAGVAFLDPERYPHGTRARYVAAKCRCRPCRDSNSAYYRERCRRAKEAAADLKPNRRKPENFYTAFIRTTKGHTSTITVAMCPGVNGRACVQGGAWLKNGGNACVACIERATVWNGLVSARRVRKHLLDLQAKGIGKHSVAAASDVSATVIDEIRQGRKKKLRAHTERRLLDVDEGARADGALVPAAKTYGLIEDLLARGFTLKWISLELGYVGSYASVLQCQKREFFTLRNATDIEKLHRRVLEQNIQPPPKWGRSPSAETFERIDWLLAQGFTKLEIERRIGSNLTSKSARRPTIKSTTAAKVLELVGRVRAGDDGPEEPLDRERYALPSIDDFATARTGA